MSYELDEKPLVSKSYTYQNDEDNVRVICSALGQIKVLNCSPDILEEVLSCVNGSNTFGDIEKVFIGRHSEHEVRNFLETILSEGIIVKSITDCKVTELPKLIVIAEGIIAETFKECKLITVARFLEEGLFCDFDIALFAPSALTYGDMFSVNEKLYELNKPFIQISFNGARITVGPLVVPNKTACLVCGVSNELKKINANLLDDNKTVRGDLDKLNYSYSLPEEYKGYSVSCIAGILHEDVTNFLQGTPSIFLDSQYIFAPDFLNFVKEKRLPTTCCDFCKAINKSYVKIDSCYDLKKYLDMSSAKLNSNSVKYQVGGLRSRTESETKELLEVELDKLGTKIKIEPSSGNLFNISNVITCYSASVDQTSRNDLPFLIREEDGFGKGLTTTQAYFSAAFELFEHMGLQYTGDIPIVCAKYSDVKDVAIDMPQLAGTIMNDFTAFDKFDANAELDWVVATSLTGTEKKLVPAFLVFLSGVNLKGVMLDGTSNGAAAALSLEDAILHGLLEIVERDAWLIGQSNPYILPVIDYDSVSSVSIQETISKIRHMGYDIITRDYTNDLKIPVYRTWIVNRDNYSNYAHTGFGCHISPEIALERSISEAVQTNDISDHGGTIESDMMTTSALSESMVSLYNQHYLVQKDILGKTSKKTKIGEPLFEMSSTLDIVRKVSALVTKKIGGDILYVDLTKPGMNVKVVKTIATGDIQHLGFPLISICKRMFNFGIKCGYSDKKTTYEELFMGAYNR